MRLVDMETLRDWECFDADSGKDLAVELREYFIPDFSHWKEHDLFQGPSLVIVVSGAATLYKGGRLHHARGGPGRIRVR